MKTPGMTSEMRLYRSMFADALRGSNHLSLQRLVSNWAETPVSRNWGCRRKALSIIRPGTNQYHYLIKASLWPYDDAYYNFVMHDAKDGHFSLMGYEFGQEKKAGMQPTVNLSVKIPSKHAIILTSLRPVSQIKTRPDRGRTHLSAHLVSSETISTFNSSERISRSSTLWTAYSR